MGVIWTIIIGFAARIIATYIMSGNNVPSGFVLISLLGIVGTCVAAYLGQSLGPCQKRANMPFGVDVLKAALGAETLAALAQKTGLPCQRW